MFSLFREKLPEALSIDAERMADNHWNRFGDTRCVRLTNPQLRTLPAARTRSAKLFVLFESS
eukprot:2828636-Pyramimonas_sp.AAC.1